MTKPFNLFFSAAIAGTVAVGLLSGAGAKEAGTAPSTNPAATRFDDWFYRCARVETTADRFVSQCEVVQILQVEKGVQNVSVLTLAIAKSAPVTGKKASSKDLMLTVVAPLNVDLPSGLGLVAGGRELDTLPFRNCNQAGCWAQLKLDGKMLRQLEKASSGEARLRMMNGQDVNLKFSLNGLSKALAELQKPAKA